MQLHKDISNEYLWLGADLLVKLKRIVCVFGPIGPEVRSTKYYDYK